MRALVTGASGFLGGRLAAMLVERGAAVTVLARVSSDLRHLPLDRLRIVRGDLVEEPALAEAAADATHIFHCAAASTDWAPLQTYVAANVEGTAKLLAAARRVPGLERFVHVSTTDVYGYPELPGDESAPLVETALPYNRTKVLGEQTVWAAGEAGLPVTVVRPGTIYGPRGKDFTLEVAALLRQRLMAVVDGGRAAGGFIYVDTVAEAMIAAAETARCAGGAYNLVDGAGVTWREYLRAFAGVLRLREPWIDLPFRAAMALAGALEVPHRVLKLRGKPLLTRHAVLLLGRSQEFGVAKAREHFGFAPAVSLEEGLRRSAAWLEAERGAWSRG